MGKDTGVEWAHDTFNIAWGCEKIEPACKNCYAAAFDHRLGGDHWKPGRPLREMRPSYWEQPLRWDAAARRRGVRRRVFVSSMTDVMLDREQMEPLRERLYDLVEDTENLDWLFLTKRVENYERFLPREWLMVPRDNVWLGATIASPDFLWRARKLRELPAAVRFVSYEPALEAVDFSEHVQWDHESRPLDPLPPLDWIIAGDESGRGARHAQMAWYRDVRDQIANAGGHTKFFLKQQVLHEGGKQRKVSLPLLDGRQWNEVPR